MDFKASVHKALEWAGKHPVPTAIGVVVIGLVLLWLFGFFKGGSSSSGSSGGSSDALGAAYYNAVGAQDASANSLMETQNTNAAAVAIAGIQGKTATDIATQQASVANTSTAANQTVSLAQVAGNVTTAGYQAQVLEHTSDNALDLGKYQADTSVVNNTISTVVPLELATTASNPNGATAAIHFGTASGSPQVIDIAGGELFSAGQLASQGFSAGQIRGITGSPP